MFPSGANALILVHLDPKNPARVLGVWFEPEDGEEPHRHYGEPCAAEVHGAQTVRDALVYGRWDVVVRRLVQRTPYGAWWEAFEVPAAMSDVEVFAQAVADFKASATAMHGASADTAMGVMTSRMLHGIDAALASAATPGARLAVLAGGPTEPFTPGAKLSTLLEFFADDDRLLVAAPRVDAEPKVVELALAYGLAWMGDRDLWLVLPEGSSDATLERVAFLDWPVRVFTYTGNVPDAVNEPRPLLQFEVLERFREESLRGTAVHDLGDRAAWVRPLIDWADHAPGVDAIHRSSYLAWHCAGRQILRLNRSKSGVAVIAGVNYSKPTADKPVPYKAQVTSAVEALSVHRAVAAAANAAANRLIGFDAGHAEHRFQALQPSLTEWLNVIELRREVPALRAGRTPAFVDLVGVDRDHRLHVVETKLGGDAMLALQALDYWIWATANRAALGTWLFGLDDPAGVTIDVVAATKPGSSATLGPYTAAQLEAFDGQISWRVVEVTGWDGPEVEVTRSPSRTVPEKYPRCTPPRWSQRAHLHLRAHAEASGATIIGAHRWKPPEAGLEPAALIAAKDLHDRGLAHSFIAHVRSSQAFALNLFAPLGSDALVGLCRSLGIAAVTAGPVIFERSDDDNLLGEWSSASPHTTQVDVAIPAALDDGGTHLLLVEVKLTETDFGACSAFRSPANDRRDVCAGPHPFGGDTAACFQLRNNDHGGRRRYDTYLGVLSEAPRGNACWFRDGMNQPMRNVALAAALVDAGQADGATFALCAPLRHRAMWRRWEEVEALFANHASVRIAALPADAVAAHHPDRDTARGLAGRYLLDEGLVERRHDRLEWQARFDGWFPDGAALEVHDEGDAPWFPLADPRPLVLDATPDRCHVEISCPFLYSHQPQTHEITSADPPSDGGGTYFELRRGPEGRRMVQAANVPDLDMRELAGFRATRDPLSISDQMLEG